MNVLLIVSILCLYGNIFYCDAFVSDTAKPFMLLFRQNQRQIVNKFDYLTKHPMSSTKLNMSQENKKRRVVRYDNLGDPVYEDELNASMDGGISILGIKTNLDAPTISLLIFGLIAFNFFVLANL